MEFKRKRRLRTIIFIVLLFAAALTSFRLLWINAFVDPEQSNITGGELDLRGWDFSDGRTITLDGEWEFYPYTWYEEGTESSEEFITVPGDWSSVLNPEDESPYGYGSYRLRIIVDPGVGEIYGIQVPSVRSSSALYVNGVRIGGSGEVGERKETAIARNIPYVSSSIHPDESGVLDVVLQVANFEDPRSSGFVRSLKFGYEESVNATTKMSMILQVGAAAIFLVHALFAWILYVIGVRDTRLLYFSLVVLAVAFSSLMSGDEKVLFEYLPMSYAGTFKLSFIVLMILSWAIVHCAKQQIDAIWKKFLPVYTMSYALIVALGLVLPMEHLTFASLISVSSVVLAATITGLAFVFSKETINGGVWLALSITALASHFGWWGYAMNTGLKTVYYPFDLIIAIVCFAGVWFRQYYEMLVDSRALALELQQADKEKDEFLANTSHELRNPLHSILNISQAVLERDHASMQSKSVKDLETVLSVSRQMSFLVNELLDMTNIKDGNPQLTLQPNSLAAITEGVIDMISFQTKGKPIDMKNHVPVDLPLVVADENRLIQILYNLLHNAVKFTYEGEISVNASIQDARVIVTIKDTGIGINPSSIPTIFDPYVQGENAESIGEGGFGLGLNISKNLVELHGSKLEVESIVGKGTTFHFALPLVDPLLDDKTKEVDSFFQTTLETAAALLNDEEEQIYTVSRKDYPRILVVDDDPVNLQVMETILAVEKYEVTTVLGGEDALSLLNEKEWDLVISDVMMPRMSGYALTSKIRERFTMTELPVLLITARSSPVDIQKGFLVGANDYLTKPIDTEEVRSRVRALTGIKQLMRERLRMEAAWLQAQIQPHFLFNALNAIIALSNIDLDRMRKALNAFSHILRRKFQFDSIHQLTMLREELELVEAYLHIEKERFQDRLHVKWEIEEAYKVMIPSLTIQPLVENAVHHGLMKLRSGGQLTIRILREASHLKFVIEDNGAGIEEEKLATLLNEQETARPGVGVLNTHLRLKRRYGEGLTITSTPSVGTTVSFRVPIN